MPVINPVFIYAINLLPNLRLVLCGILFVLFFVVLVSAMLFDTSYGEENKEKYSAVFKKSLKVAVVILFLLLVVPTRETVVQMIVANNVTVEDFETVKKLVENLLKK